MPSSPKLGSVKLLKQVKLPHRWMLSPALFDSRGRIRPDHVRVKGKDETHPEGSYFVEWWDRGERHREAVGPNAQDAVDKARVKEAQLTADLRGFGARKTFQVLHARRGDPFQVLFDVGLPRRGGTFRHLARCRFQTPRRACHRKTALGISP